MECLKLLNILNQFIQSDGKVSVSIKTLNCTNFKSSYHFTIPESHTSPLSERIGGGGVSVKKRNWSGHLFKKYTGCQC